MSRIFDLKEKCQHSLVVPTSMGIRITPANGQPVYCTDTYKMFATSAETNVATILSTLGLSVKVLTTFVKNSSIAEFIKSDLRSRNLMYEGVERESGGPWGYRHQFNIADSGCGVRGPFVLNDRAGEVGRELNAKDFDLDRIFGLEGVQVLHLSGLIAALSQQTSEFCLVLAQKARKYGALVSFDLNYRASFWKGREKELYQIFNTIAEYSDILVGNEEDFQLCLNIKGPETGGNNLSEKIDHFKEMIKCVQGKYKNARIFATTLRQVISSNLHLWGSVMFANDTWNIIKPREIQVLDRIGGGDAFVGGMLYGILKEYDLENCNQFAWASGALATTFLTDYAIPSNEEQIWNIYNGNARVKR